MAAMMLLPPWHCRPHTLRHHPQASATMPQHAPAACSSSRLSASTSTSAAAAPHVATPAGQRCRRARITPSCVGGTALPVVVVEAGTDPLAAPPSRSTAPASLTWSPSSPAASTPADPQQQRRARNHDALASRFLPTSLSKLLGRLPPQLLAEVELSDWLAFFEGYGLDTQQVYKLLKYRSREALSNNTPYNAGQVVLRFKAHGGWTDRDVVERLVACYPHLLAVPVADIDASLDTLRGLGFDDADVAWFLGDCPELVCPRRRGDLFVVVERIRRTAETKYKITGAYHL